MNDKRKTKEQLIDEVIALRGRVAELEAAQVERMEAESRGDGALALPQQTEKQFQAAAARAGDWEFWMGSDGSVLHVSPACEWISGYRAEEFRNDPGLLLAITHPDDRELVARHLEETPNTLAEAYIEFRIITRSGEECWIGHLCQPVFSPDGRYIGQRASNYDVTKGVSTELALQLSEERFRQLAENLDEVFWLMSPDETEVYYVNPAYERLTGRSCESLCREPASWRQLLHPEDQRRISAVTRTRGPGPYNDVWDDEFRFLRSDGSLAWVWMRTRPIFGDGRIVARVGVATDITDRMQAAREIKERQMYLERILAAAPDAIVTLDADHKIVEWNPGAEKLFGYTREEVIGLDIDGLITTSDVLKEAKGFTKAALSGHDVGPVETVRYHKDGSPVHVILAGSPILMRNELIGLVAVYRGIGERVLAEETLKRRNRELTTLLDAATAISSNLTLDVVLETVAQQMTRALDTMGCSLSLWDRQRDELETLVEYRTSNPDMMEPSGTVYDLRDFPAMRYVLQSCQPQVIQHDDPAADRAELAFMAQQEIFTLLMLPLKTRDRVIGLAELFDDEERRNFSFEEMRLAESLASQAAIAIENARLYGRAQREITERVRAEKEIRRRNREMALLNRVIMASTSTLDVEHVLDVTCRELAHAFNLPQAAAALLNAQQTEASVVAEYLKPGRASTLGSTVPVTGNALLEALLQKRGPLTVADGWGDSEYGAIIKQMQERGTASLLIVPIILARGRVAGFIGLEASEPRVFSEEESSLAQNVAAAAGQALEIARLYHAVRSHAERLQETIAQRTAELQEALKRARDADRVKSEFVSNVSHELRTPLTNLKLYLSLLTRGVPEKRQTYLDTLQREADRLQSLIEALLDISRLDLGKTQVDLQPTDLNVLVGTLIADRVALAAERGLSLDVEPAARLPLVLADVRLIEQVLSNLLTNAINYTPPGGTILLRTAAAEDDGRTWATVSVRDTGPGISAKDRKNLFERFYRGEAGRGGEAPGTGLGLAICKEILDRHKGHINFESEPGKGSTFTVWLSATDLQ